MIILDSRLTFNDHLNYVLSNVSKKIGLLHKLQNTLPRPVLMGIHEAFKRPHLDYGDILYD